MGENQASCTSSVGPASFHSVHGVERNLTTAATVLVVLPLIVLFFFAQQQCIEGIEFSGVEG